MKHNHNNHEAIRTNPDLDVPDIEPLPYPEELIAPRTEKWEGQTLDLSPGIYKASWVFKNKEKGKYKGCKIHTYEFTFSKRSEKSMAGMKGEFTIHTRKSGASIRSKIDILVDQNGNGKYEDNEILISSGKEGYRVRDAITDYTTYDFEDALNLRQLKRAGELSFDTSNISSSYGASDINFKNIGKNRSNEFSINFIDYGYEELIVCWVKNLSSVKMIEYSKLYKQQNPGCLKSNVKEIKPVH